MPLPACMARGVAAAVADAAVADADRMVQGVCLTLALSSWIGVHHQLHARALTACCTDPAEAPGYKYRNRSSDLDLPLERRGARDGDARRVLPCADGRLLTDRPGRSAPGSYCFAGCGDGRAHGRCAGGVRHVCPEPAAGAAKDQGCGPIRDQGWLGRDRRRRGGRRLRTHAFEPHTGQRRRRRCDGSPGTGGTQAASRGAARDGCDGGGCAAVARAEQGVGGRGCGRGRTVWRTAPALPEAAG
eukprot:scaffold5212_cov108-Isochrysis_galbana.AAC.2